MAVSGDVITTVAVTSHSPGPDNYVPSGHTQTILLDSTEPVLAIEVLPVRVGTPKPTIFQPMTTFLLPVITHFWPMWEASGATVADIIDSDYSGVITETESDLLWGTGKNGYALVATSRATGDDVTVPAIVLTGSFSLDWFANPGSGYHHYLVTNDPVNGLIHYLDGVQQSLGAYATSMTISGLFQFVGITTGVLEYVRTWARVLNLVEIQSLAADPYCMFGITQQTLDEISTVIDFMTPSKEDWYFLFT